MRFFLAGCGSIGIRHIKNIQTINPKIKIDVYDVNTDLMNKTCKKYNLTPTTKKSLANTRYDCVFICTPPSSHVSLAKDAVNAKSNIFIEKPLAVEFKEVKLIQQLVKKKKVLAFVGYNFRFHKALNIIKKKIDNRRLGKVLHVSAYFGQYLPDWRPNQDYRKNYTARKELGGGIIHDSSHEIDYLRWLFGEPKYVQSDYEFSSFLRTNTEAIADINGRFEKNILFQIHLDYLRRKYKRSLEILCQNGIIEWSLKPSVLKIFDSSKNKSFNLQITDDVNEMYVKEIKHILDCIKKNRSSKIIGLENGIATFNVLDAIKKSGRSGKRIFLSR